MDKKLTLKLDKDVIENAKKYASLHQRSLSKIIESYLKSLTTANLPDTDEIKISPFVKSMTSGGNIPGDLDYKTDYSNYITEKYK